MFTTAEINLMVIYNTGTRKGLITELQSMTAYLFDDEADLLELTYSTIAKLKDITDADYAALDLDPDALKGW